MKRAVIDSQTRDISTIKQFGYLYGDKFFMMDIKQSVRSVLKQLETSIVQLSDEQYSCRVNMLSEASVGQHVRHVLAMFICLQEGYERGIVNYEKRKRDVRIENSRTVALLIINEISNGICQENKDIVLEAGFDEDSNELLKFPTNYYRELAYNIEHAIHHMALIRIGINEVSSISLPEGYGVASSTMKYRKTVS
ncbi:MAG TPA: hypothetical protein VMT76_11585 [Puia sp.]|nr:hypothetical protein [Puia sp.]